MTSGKKKPRQSLHKLLIFLCIIPAQASVAQAWTIQDLMAAVSVDKQQIVAFTETRTMASLTQPLIVEGVLRHESDNHLEKEILRPFRERYVIHQNTFRLYREGEPPREVEISDYPPLRGFVASFSAIRNGNLALLEQYYQIQLSGDRQDWQLILEPIDESLARHIKAITVTGQAGQIHRIVTLQTDGDTTDMQIHNSG